jgi:hypothetical protein
MVFAVRHRDGPCAWKEPLVRIDNCHAGRVRLGDPLLDRYLEFVEGRARPNTVLATASDLRLFFAVVASRRWR